MIEQAATKQNWLPSSWLYVGFGVKRLWSRLNAGDRLVALFALLLIVALPIGFIVRLARMVAVQNPNLGGITVGSCVFAVVSLALTGSMARVRSKAWFRFLPETLRRQRERITLEFLVSCFATICLLIIIASLLPAAARWSTCFQAVSLALKGHTVVHVVQFLLRHSPTLNTGASAVGAMSRRSKTASLLASSMASILPRSSSLFWRKANDNPLVWGGLMLTLLASGGTAISLGSPLLGLSSLSSLLLIFQLSLLEPRVGNGPAIGAHSQNLPIRRAVKDLIALSLPHTFVVLVALPLIWIEKSALYLAIAGGQLIVTIWITWLFLVVGALPAHKPAKSFFWFVGGALISSQLFPALIIVWLVVITVMLTRDLRHLSLEGPALWPR
jgi:hypothetical protein